LGDYVRGFASYRDGAPWPTIAAIAVETLRALDAAHTREDEKGRPAPILHRDVTPGNILIDARGVVKLADFGMARALDRARTTQPDMVKGKLSYLAPELVLGQDPSPRSDLFALGIAMWEALTGERLFDAGTDVEVVEAVRDARVPLLSSKRPKLPLGLATVVHRALEREPELRPASAREMLHAITGELRVLPSTTDSMSLAEGVRRAQETLGRK
jgi:serine/threonine-protein kinase